MVTYSDNFARSDTTSGLGVIPSGPSWQVLRGTWKILSQRAYTGDSPGTNPIAVAEFQTPEIDLSAQTAYGGDAVYFRVLDANNWLRARRRGYTTTTTTEEPVYSTRTVYTYETQYEYEDWEAYTEHTWECYYGQSYSHNAPYYITRSGRSYPSEGQNCPTSITHEHGSYPRHSHMYGNWLYTGSTQQAEVVGYYWATSKRGSEDVATGRSKQVQTGSYEETYQSGTTTKTTTNYYYRVYFEECVSGTITSITSAPTVSSTTALRVVASGTSIQIYVGGTLEINTTRSTHSTRTKHGIGRGASERNSHNIDNFSISVGNRAPSTPTLQSPNGGEIWDAIHTIKWSKATDPDGDSLVYDIELNLDGTSGSWVRIATGVTGTSLSYDFTDVPETTAGRIRIRSSDGSRVSGWDMSNANFTIDHRTENMRAGMSSPHNLYLGSSLVDRVYAGSTLVFGKEP